MNQNKILLSFFAVLFSLYTYAADGNGHIRGTVLSSDGKPADGVTVILKGTNKTTITDDKGLFAIRNIPEGSYELVIMMMGNKPQQQSVDVKADQSVTVTVQLDLSSSQLQEVEVTSRQNKFARKESDNVARMSLKNMENPQSYNVIPKELLAEQTVVDYRSALKNVPGANSTTAPNGAVFLRMRGFYTGSYVRNGLASQQYLGMDPVNIERIEVLRGPSGTLFGSSLISFGGLTNRVTKKPFDTFKGEVSYAAGSWDLSRLTLDVNTPLNKEKTALMRVNAAVTSIGTFQDYGFEKTYAVAPSFLFKINERLSLLLDVELYKANRIAATYPTIANVTATSFKDLTLGYKKSLTTNDEMVKQNLHNIFAQAVYKIADNWTSSTLFAASGGGWDTYTSVTANWLSDSSIRRSLSMQRPRNINSINFQENINGDFYVGKLRNRVLAGVDVYATTTKVQSYNAITYDTVITNKPVRAISMERVNTMFATQLPTATVSDQLQYAAYASDVLNVTNNLNLMLSLRVDRFENKGTSTNGGDRAGKYSQTALSPKLGIVYELLKDRVAVFANYMNGFQNLAPVTQPDVTTLALDAQQANQWEGGVKLDVFNHKLMATLSYYDIKVSNSTRTETRTYNDANNQPVSGNFTVQDGTQRSKGVDVELIANPVNGLNIILGYGYNDNRFTEAAAAVKGKFATMAPSNMGNCWISYKFPVSAVKGLGVAAGANYVGASYWNGPNTFEAPEYTTIDGSIFYDKSAWRFGFKVNNIANQQGWSINGDPIALRQLIGNIAFRF